MKVYPFYYRLIDEGNGYTNLLVYMYDYVNRKLVIGKYDYHRPFLVVEEKDLPKVKKIVKGEDYVVDIRKDPRDGYYRVLVKSPTNIRRLRSVLNAEGVKTYEDDIKYIMRVMIDGDIPAKPVEVYLQDVEETDDYVKGVIAGISELDEELDLKEVPVLAFDIEVSHPKEVFPNPREYPIFLLSVAIAENDNIEYYVYVNTDAFEDELLDEKNGTVEEIEYRGTKAKIHYLPSERDVILAFTDLIRRRRVFLITGYNSDTFDWQFVIERAKLLGIYDKVVEDLSPFGEEPVFISVDEKDPTFSLIKPQSQKERTFFVPGRVNVDIFQLIRLPMNKPIVGNITPLTLKNVASELGILPKSERVLIDLSTTDMETEWKKDHLRVITYNLDDAYATVKLALSFVAQSVVLSAITNIPLQFSVKWPNSKILTVLFGRESLKEGLLIPHSRGREEELGEAESEGKSKTVKYRGAFVIHPDPSMVKNLMILDFQSLYPNIIINFNLGGDALLGSFRGFDEEGNIVVEDRGQMKRIPFNTREINVVPFVWHVFYSREHRESFVSKVVNNLLTGRIKMKHTAKKLGKFLSYLEENPDKPLEEAFREFMEKTKFPFGEKEFVEKAIKDLLKKYGDNREEFIKNLKVAQNITDTKQTALKFLVNSTYGVLGFQSFRWYEARSAESVTAYGRWLIMRTKEFLEKAGFVVVSGDTDSVMIALPENIIYTRRDEEAARTREEYIREYEEAKRFIRERLRQYLEDEGYLIYHDIDKLLPKWFETVREETGMEPEEAYRKMNPAELGELIGDFCSKYLYTPFKFVLEFDKLFEKVIFLMAKNYVSVAKGKLKLKGIEAKKRNFSILAREEQLYLINLLMDLFPFIESLKNGEPDYSLLPENHPEIKEFLKDVKTLEDFIAKLVLFLERRLEEITQKIRSGEYPIEYFVKYTELGKNPDEYDVKGSAGVYAAMAEMREFPDVVYTRGDRIGWVYALDPSINTKKATKSMFARTVSHVVRKGLKIYPTPYIEEVAGRYDKILHLFGVKVDPSKFLKLIENGTQSLFAFNQVTPVEKEVVQKKPMTLEDFIGV